MIMPKIVATEEQWIQIGIHRFAQNGTEGLVIEKMAAELGCSKSSFYWYFKNRQEFLHRIVQEWINMSTSQVIRTSLETAAAEQQLESLLDQMFSATRKGDFLFYLRKLASTDPAYQPVIDQMEQKRMDYAEELFRRAGMSDERARQKSVILYHYYLGWYERHKQAEIADEELQRHIRMLRELIIEI
ncbi:TetR/AcrR family transcriptional regulator [Paenibacillus tarimensis]|uniref:TetR/AcrR family transcriptional regulator n=1 Tax=Paenibacillus tarimensis TaxID=416012 RepID=UPI001F31FD60|nr:TetR/AcrR family transcriptional regulator [Paenibacillus tarimensis]MCF2945754.1 TetR/AcrR family transcriptional regulator [Paenibacillus tarimensis]